METTEKIIIYQVFTRLFGNQNKTCRPNGSLEENGCGKMNDFTKQALHESRIWPLEVGLVFERVEGVHHLNESQQNKLKAHINQLWLERTPSTEIITIASGLVSSMQGVSHA